ncbi:hypothetical protein [Paraburkholderia xenovorans]|uniref:hypothetical protein n=1 Tax=Paraburkholderia xenovorans TaxID=36873 RepID=UPI0015C53292|nr:hypothetical protein [Paraburkholderia xenovorans]NPT35622.1 hypothetical protein [Paraburkholderia xenovorans]
MESNMRVGMQPVTGQESYWGDVKLTPKEIGLINASPTLQSQLRHYGADVSSGMTKPMALGTGRGTYFEYKDTNKRIVIGKGNQTLREAGAMVGTLSHEMGHYENQTNDKMFKSRYEINPRDPNAYNVAALTGVHQEGEAGTNNWQVQQEIEKNTAPPNAPGTRIYLAGTNRLQQTLDEQHAADRQDGKTDAVHRNHLTIAGMSDFANNTPSTAPGKSYYQSYGDSTGVPAPVPGRQKDVTFQGDDNGDINQMTESWESGELARQTFSEGKIQSSEILNDTGKVTSASVYKHNQDGSYSVDVRNGDGHETEHAEFKADKSGTVRNYANDGSAQAVSFNTDSLATQIMDYNVRGQRINANYLDPDTGHYTVQDKTTPDGGHTVINCDTEGRVRSQSQYDRNGKITLSADFSETGDNTFAVHYKEDGSRFVVKFNADGSQTNHIVDRNGNRGRDYTAPTPGSTRPANATASA